MAKNETVKEELATVDNNELATQVSFDDISANKSGVINTVNTDSFEGKVIVANALNSATSLQSVEDAVMCIKDCILMPGIRKGRNGAPDTECTNTYLIDTEGNAFFSQSDGVARSARMLAMMFPDFGKNTPNGYLSIRVTEQKLPNGNTIKNLVLDM